MPAVSRKAAKNAGKTSSGKRRSDTIDIYIRMNEDPDKDYCFNVPTNAPVSWLQKIFDTIPVLLTPSYFFHPKPEGFSASIHPGYLTAEGALLFTDNAHHDKWLKHIANDALIGDVIAEGQLVVPKWKADNLRQYTTITILLVWLYLDLPDFISPTPGMAPSNLIFWAAEQLSYAPQAPGENSIFNHPYAQLLFFAFHLFKVGAIYLMLWNGFWNPRSLSPFAKKEAIKLPKPEQLAEIGWTGARRITPFSWEDKYHDYRTKRAGGVVEAYRFGLLTKPKGYVLNDGEGWNALKTTTVDGVLVEKDLLDAEGKFVVSRQYFLELAKPLSQMISKNSTATDDSEMIKNFRSYGYLDGPKLLQELFADLIPMHTGNK